MEEREGDLTSKHATEKMNTKLACVGLVGSCLSLLEAIYLS
jgi:hypothetical protein